MADITKCGNEMCPLRMQCYRHMAKDSLYQSYADFAYRVKRPKGANIKYECENFMELPEEMKNARKNKPIRK